MSSTKKYCIYFPYRLDVEELEKIKDEDELYTCIKQYLINEDLDTKLTTIRKFIRFQQESELILLQKDKKIYAVIFSRDGYKPFNILPIINDMDNMQSFIALSTCWVELNEITLLGKTDQEHGIVNTDVNVIQQLYDLNRPTLIPLIEQTLNRLFHQYLFNKEYSSNKILIKSNL